MKSIDLRHRLAAVLLAVCLVVCCALPAFATSANIVLGRLGSLHGSVCPVNRFINEA